MLLPPTHKPAVYKHLVEDIILNKARAKQFIAQNPDASQKPITHDLNSSLEEPTLTPARHLMSEIGLLEMSTREQWESLQIAAEQQQIYETELHHLRHAIDEAQKKLQASPITAENVEELKKIMAERTNLTEQIKYYNIKIRDINEKVRQLILDSAQLSPSVFRKHYHPESAYSDYFAATSQHKRGVFPFHSPGQLFYDCLPVFNSPNFSDDESSSPLARTFQDELENGKQSEHPKSVYGMTPISHQLPRLIPPPRTDSIPRPTWSGEILSTAVSLSDMTRGTSISHSMDSLRTMAKTFEASASSPKSIGAVSVSNKQTHEVCFSTATVEASPEYIQSVDAANTATTDSNNGESPSVNVLICDTNTSAMNAAAEKLRLFAESGRVSGLQTEIFRMHGSVNENKQRSNNDFNTSSDFDPKTEESCGIAWALTASPSTETQHDRDSDEHDSQSSLGTEVNVTPHVHAATAKTESEHSIPEEFLQGQELILDIRNHTNLINEIADQRRYPALSAVNIITDAEVRENWQRLNKDLEQRTKALECIIRTSKPEDLVMFSLHAPAKRTHSTKEFEKIVKSVADLNNACNLQETHLHKNQLFSKEVLTFQQQHQLVLQNISNWLDLAEQQLFTVPISTEEQIEHNENLRRQIQCLQINVDGMSKRPNLQAAPTVSNNRELIEKCHSSLNERLKMIDTTIKLQAEDLQQTDKQLKQYHVEAANMQRQLQDIQKAILLPTVSHSLDQQMSNNQKTEAQLKICENHLQELKTMESSLTQKCPKGFFMSELMPLQSKYVELQRKISEKKSSIQNLIIFQDQYKKMLKDCADFIDMAENKLRTDFVSTKDLSHLKTQSAASKDFFNDIEIHKAMLDSLARSCDPSTRIQFQQQHASLSTRILVLVGEASLQGHRLEHLTHQWADLEEKYTMLQDVLLSLEAQMPESVDSMNSLAAIQDKCNKYKLLEEKLADSRDTLFEVMMGKQILHSINCPSLEAIISELEKKWLCINTKVAQELNRTESLGNLLSVFETDLAKLSTWLVTARMKLDGFKNLSPASLQNIRVVRCEVEKILEFSKEMTNQVLFKDKVICIGHQLLENNTCDASSLSRRLHDCEKEWKQVETVVAETQEYLFQVQMTLMPSHQVLKELTDWIGKLSKSVEKDGCFVTNTTQGIEYMMKKYQGYQTELAGRQISLDFVNRKGLASQEAEISAPQEKLKFAENLQELNKQWHQMTKEVNDKLNTLEGVHSKWVEYGKAVEKLQSWFHQQEDRIQDYRHVGNEVEVKQTLEDYSVLQQQLQSKQAELAVLVALGNDLIELSHDFPDSQQSINDCMSTLDHKINKLEEHTKQQYSLLTDALGHWTQYHSDLANLNQIVTQVDIALDHYKLLRGDTATLQSQVIKLKDLHAHLENNSGQLKSFSAVACQLKQVCGLSVQVDIQNTVSGMQNKWIQLNTDLIQRCNEYEHYLDEWQLFENHYIRMLDWLDAKETMCIDLGSVTVDSVFPETLTKCTQLQQELDSFQSQTADLHRQNAMLTNHMNPSTVSVMKSRQSAIDQKLLALKHKLYQLSNTISNDLSMREKFEDIFGAVRKFLSYVEVVLDIVDPMKTAERETIQLRSEQLNNLLLLFNRSYKEFDDVNDLGYQLTLSKNDARRLQELNHKWYMLYEDTKERSRTLQGDLLQHQDFTSKCEAWKTFMIQTEQKLADKVKGNLADLSDHLRSSEQFENELFSRQQIINAIISDGQKMIGSGEVVDNGEFQRNLNLVFEQWQSICRKASQRKIAIKKIVNKWHTFNALSQQLKAWVKDTENYLQTSPSESNSLQVKNSIEKLQEVQHEFQIQETTYNNILDLAGLLTQHADNKSAKEIKDTLSDIHQNRHKILTVIEERKIQLEDIGQQWIGCEREVDDMLCQLTAIRSILNTDIPTTYDELQIEINKCKSIEKEFIESENKEQILLAKEQQLVKTIQTDDMRLLRQRIQLLIKQRGELQRRIKVREDKIIDALFRLTHFNKSWKALMCWIEDMTIKIILNEDLSVEDLLTKLENEYKQEVENKEVEKALILEQGRQLIKICDDLRVSEIEQKLPQIEEQWQHLKKVMDARCCKLRETVMNWKQLDTSTRNLNQWLSTVENVLNKDITFNGNDIQDVEAKLQYSKELQQDIERHSESVSALLNLCEVLLNDPDACPTETEYLPLEHFIKVLEKHWQTIYIVSSQGKTRETWQLLRKFSNDCGKFSEWITQMEKKVRESEIEIPDDKTEKTLIEKLESSWIQYQEILTAIDDYHLWLEKIEAQVRHCELDNFSVVQSVLLEKYDTLQALHNEVINNQTQILTLKETADQLLKSTEFPQFSTARDKIYIVHKRVQTLTHLILSYIAASEKRMETTPKKDAQGFPILYSRTTDKDNMFTEHNFMKTKNTVSPALLIRAIRAALFIQPVLLLLFLLFSLIPVCEDENSCKHRNNLQHSVVPMLRYADGAPPT